MNLFEIMSRVKGRYQRTLCSVLFRRPIKICGNVPYISFTFDDFPRSAVHSGGEILQQFGLRATYYASLGLMGKHAPPGDIFVPDDIKKLLVQGHELGCHTFAHCDSWETAPGVFEESIIKNKRALDDIVPGATFTSFSYPISGPRPDTKRRAGRHFRSCRCGGQTFNAGVTDLNLLKAFFLEQSRGSVDLVKGVIDKNTQRGGWLIFATHDIDGNPSRFGVTPSFFEEIVKYALDSSARILPVSQVLDDLQNDPTEINKM